MRRCVLMKGFEEGASVIVNYWILVFHDPNAASMKKYQRQHNIQPFTQEHALCVGK